MIPSRDPGDVPVATLVEQLFDDGKAYVRAEVDVAKRTAGLRIAALKTAIIFGVVAIFIAQAGLTVLFIAIGSALALLVGTWGGQLISAILALALAGGMAKYAASRFSAPSADSNRGASR